MALFLGIDGGGSKTACAVGDEAAILGRGAAGGSNLVRLEEARVREALQSAIAQACADAQVSRAHIAKTCLGVAGAGRAEINHRMRAILGEIVGGAIEVVGDMDISMRAAFQGGPGVIVIAGTGSIAFGRNRRGRTARAGGWGFAISDEGSGHWIGQRAVAAALRARDQNREAKQDENRVDHPGVDEHRTGVLLQNLLQALGLDCLDKLVIEANRSLDFATLFPAVVQASEASDPLASGILLGAGMELAELARIVIVRLREAGEGKENENLNENENMNNRNNKDKGDGKDQDKGTGWGDDDKDCAVPVAISGGVFRHSRLVRETFLSHLGPAAKVNPKLVDPLEGALALARR